PSAGCCVPSNDDGQTPSPACCTIDGRTPKPSPVSPGLPIRPAELCIPHMAEYACGIAATGIQQDTPFFAAYRFPQRCASSRTSLLCVYLI
ncbi:MAG: hypothetical protein FJY97_20115, partial [candidate division Zixibacteria bacterium]|nr:hypothetical protein [candidate division Zixibacteria bacterium]